MRAILACTACLFVLAPAYPAAAPADGSAGRMDQIVQYWVDDHQFMGAVLVARGDKILFKKAYGSANLEWSIPNTTTTRFRIASVTKQFTAAAILLLEERGKLRIEDPIKKYYPDAPAAWDKISLVNLLQHTSGIANYTDEPDMGSWMTQPNTPAELVKRVRDKPLQFEPGAEMRYSNTGYVLLGIAIEKASGMSYAAFLKQNIFDPLGMKDSGYDENEPIVARRAAGYSQGPTGPINAKYTDMTTPFSAGALYSTVEDLLRWERALFGKKVLSEASLKKMTTPGKNDYAFGLYVSENGRPTRHPARGRYSRFQLAPEVLPAGCCDRGGAVEPERLRHRQDRRPIECGGSWRGRGAAARTQVGAGRQEHPREVCGYLPTRSQLQYLVHHRRRSAHEPGYRPAEIRRECGIRNEILADGI